MAVRWSDWDVTEALTATEALEAYGAEHRRTLARHALWRAGRLEYLLHKGRPPDHPLVQRYVPEEDRGTSSRGQIHAYRAIEKAREDDADTFVVKTGRQWGKSLLFVVICATMCIRAMREGTEVIRIPYAAPTGKQVDEFITPHFRMLQEHAPPELMPEQQGDSWVFPRGDRVVVSGCEDKKKADRLRGPRAHLAIVDEAGFIPIVDYVIESVLGWQLATTGGMMLVSSTPPESLDHAFVGVWEAAKAKGYAFESTSPEAPHMTEKLIKKLIARVGGQSTLAWLREALARLLVDPDITVFPEFSVNASTVVVERERPSHFHPCVIGDGGFVDLGVYAFGYYDFERDVTVIEDEVAMSRSRSDELDSAIAAKELELWGDHSVKRRRVDAPGQVRIDMSNPELQSDAFAATGKDVEWWEDAAEKANRRYWGPVTKPRSKTLGSMQAGANRVRVAISQQKLEVHPRCRTLIEHATNARWDNGRTDFVRVQDARSGKVLHHYDGAAALVYFVRDVDRSNPYPLLPDGVSEDDHFVHPSVAAKKRRVEDVFFPKKGR